MDKLMNHTIVVYIGIYKLDCNICDLTIISKRIKDN